MVKGKNLAK